MCKPAFVSAWGVCVTVCLYLSMKLFGTKIKLSGSSTSTFSHVALKSTLTIVLKITVMTTKARSPVNCSCPGIITVACCASSHVGVTFQPRWKKFLLAHGQENEWLVSKDGHLHHISSLFLFHFCVSVCQRKSLLTDGPGNQPALRAYHQGYIQQNKLK